jgi:hypothetical protein
VLPHLHFTGVTKHVGDAISDRTAKTKNKVVTVGVTSWGIVERKEDLLGRDVSSFLKELFDRSQTLYVLHS